MTQELILFYVAGYFGMIAHWAKRWARAQTAVPLYHYMFTVNKKRSLATAISYTLAVVAMVQAGIDMTGIEALALAVTTGYTIDSSVNSDTAPRK